MPKLQENAFTFQSHALPKDTFTVVRFSGEEGFSSLYRFDILLISEREDIDLGSVLKNPATFTITGQFSGGTDIPVHGILSAFEQMHQADNYIFYRAELRPRSWWLTLTHHNQVFLNKKPGEFLKEVLTDGGLSDGIDYEFPLKTKFPAFEYICQYGESHFDFFSRWAEFGGGYFWFEQGENAEKMILSDSMIAHKPLAGYECFPYLPPSGMTGPPAGQSVSSFLLRQSPLPQKVVLRDYNYLKPSLDIQGHSQVASDGHGTVYLYGDHPRTQDGANYIAGIRAEEYRCREKVFHGVSSIPAVRSGYQFDLARHYRQDFNQKYLTLSVLHEGSQERYLVGGLGLNAVDQKDALFYRNTFVCIPATTQYRPERKTPKPHIFGTLSAKIDAAGSGQYAELDEQGRYKVILPFDLSGREGGKASAWLRMATPYAGENHGMHFPLLKGAEVLLSFEEGDMDRPIILGAVHNADKKSIVTNRNEPMNVIRTASGNELVMGDEQGKSFIGMKLPQTKGGMVLAESGEGDQDKGKSTFFNVVDGHFEGSFDHKTEVVVGTSNEAVGGIKNEIFLGGAGELKAGLSWEASLGQAFAFSKGDKIEFGSETFSYHDTNEVLGEERIELKAGLGQVTASLVDKLKKAFLAAVATTMADAGTTMTAMQGFKNPKHMYSEGTTEALKIAGSVGTGVATLFGASLMAYIHNLISTIENSQKGPYAAAMELSMDHGVEISVDNTVGKKAKFVVMVTDEQSGSKISITKNGEKVIINNKTTAKIQMIGGDTIRIKNESGKLNIDDDAIILKRDDGSKIKLDRNGITAWKEDGGCMILDNTSANMQAGNQGMCFNKNTGFKMKATSINKKASGTLQLDGGIIKLG